jgi:hypothetical protein
MTPTPSAASTGGSGGASGVGFQNLVFGWSASSLIAEEPLLHPLVAGTVVQVGAQTGFAVDDVAAMTDLGNMAFFQAEVGLGLGSTEDSPLAEALEQAVSQFLDGHVPQPGADARPYGSAAAHPSPSADLIWLEVIVSFANVPKSVPIRHENGPRRDLRGPFYLVAGTGFEPATSGL